MAYGISRGPPVDDADLTDFVETLSTLRAEDWQKRIAAAKVLVGSIPDYSTTPLIINENNGDNNGGATAAAAYDNGGTPSKGSRNQTIIPWYRSSKSVRRLGGPLKTLLLDARSAVVKEATELIGTLLMVKLQPHPSLTMAEAENEKGDDDQSELDNALGLETINGSASAFNAQKRTKQPPPPAFVGRLLMKDLLPTILDMSKQTVKVIRNYGVNMTIDVLPHCRVKSCIIILLERMKTHQNRTLREDSARYLRCVLDTWPWDSTGSSDNVSNEGIGIVNSRKEERLSLDSTRQIGLGLGRTLSDSTKPVREEAKRGFQVLFRRFRPVWDEVMCSGVVRDVRLRKKLLEQAASRTDGNLFDDTTSLGELSLNSAVSGVSGLSYSSYRSTASSRYAISTNGVPSMIGTPKTSPRMRARQRQTIANSPGYMSGTGSSAYRNSEQLKRQQTKESSDKVGVHEYVTSSGHVITTPSPRKAYASKPLYGGGSTSEMYGGGGGATMQQPFASLLETPSRPLVHQPSPRSTVKQSPASNQKSCNVLRKRLSRRISVINDESLEHVKKSPGQLGRQLSSINESEDRHNGNSTPPPSAMKDSNTTEITNVALEVIAAHLSHLEQIETHLSYEKEILLDLNKQLGISISDGTKTSELAGRLASLTEEQVCDYFESVHLCADAQRNSSETLLKEMERISEGDMSAEVNGIESPEVVRQDFPQSPLEANDQMEGRDLKDEFF